MEAAPLEKIGQIIAWYQSKRDLAPTDIETLINAARRLSCEIYFFANEVGDLHSDMLSSEYRRKSETAKFIQGAKQNDEKLSIAQIEKDAQIALDELHKEEMQAASMYRSAMLIYQSAQSVHEQLRQHISYLKEEKRQEQINGQNA